MMRFFALFFSAVLYYSCQKSTSHSGDTASGERVFELNFFHVLDNSDLNTDSETVLTDGRKIQFRYVRHIFSNIFLINEMGDTAIPSIDRVLIKESVASYPLGTISLRPGIWKMYVLYGLDSVSNTTIQPSMVENANDPLAPQYPSMYWTWESGYLFTRIEALADTSRIPSGQINGFVDYHLGMTGLARLIGPFDVDLSEIKASSTLRCNLEPVIKSVVWPEEFSTHTFENLALAEKLMSGIALNIRSQ